MNCKIMGNFEQSALGGSNESPKTKHHDRSCKPAQYKTRIKIEIKGKESIESGVTPIIDTLRMVEIAFLTRQNIYRYAHLWTSLWGLFTHYLIQSTRNISAETRSADTKDFRFISTQQFCIRRVRGGNSQAPQVVPCWFFCRLLPSLAVPNEQTVTFHLIWCSFMIILGD